MKRVLDCRASDFRRMDGQELKQAIRASEGRVMVSETIATVPSLYSGVTNAELAASFGSDFLLLNLFDVFQPVISGYTFDEPGETVRKMKQMTGRPVGLNLEPVDVEAKQAEDLDTLAVGRTAGEASLHEAKKLGFDFVCLTGNPKTGVTNDEMIKAIARTRDVFGQTGLIIAGKMHGAGVANEMGSDIISNDTLEAFVNAGADVVLLPSPGTIPGMTVEVVADYVRFVHSKGALAMLATGTSQEGADEATIRQIALNSKMAGADLYHIGDAGLSGIAVPENIMTYSIAIRGRRHTYRRMASSVLR